MSVEQSNEDEQKYGKINDLFKNRRKRNELMEDFKAGGNPNKPSAAVKYVEDKIRFVKSGKVGPKSDAFKRF
jgi:hypothetical protein